MGSKNDSKRVKKDIRKSIEKQLQKFDEIKATKIELGREDAVRCRGPKRVGGRGGPAELKLVRVLVF